MFSSTRRVPWSLRFFADIEEAPAIRLCPENEKIKLGYPAFYTKKQLLYCCCFDDVLPSLKLTFSHLKMDGWTTSFLLGPGLFSGAKMLVLGSGIVWWLIFHSPRWELVDPDENVEKLPKGLAPYASPMQTAAPWLTQSVKVGKSRNGCWLP